MKPLKRLGPRVELALDPEQPVLRYLPLPGLPDAPPLGLHPLLAAVLAIFDRGASVEDVTEQVSARLQQEPTAIREIAEDAHACFRKHYQHRGEGSFVAGSPELLLDRLAAGGGAFCARDVVFPGDRALFPLTLQWLVTRYCNRNCVYCYAGAIPSARAKDAEISCERVCGALSEAARLGAYNFFMTGGEPLLRDDAYEVLTHAIRLGMVPEVISKQFVPDWAADLLAEAGLPQIFFSIDSLVPEVAARLTGVRRFAHEISRAVERLVARGITVNAKSVLTSYNIDTVPATVTELERLGVSWVGLELYSRNLQRHSDHLIPSEEQLLRLRDWVEAFTKNGDHAITVNLAYKPDRERKKPADLGEDCFVCANGTTALLFLPDGRVSRCDKRLPGTEMVVGDLRTQSVHEVWNSPAMIASMKPPREFYAGTRCYGCELFDACHERGRCYYSAYLTSGTLYGPQGNCPYVEADGRPFAC